MKRFFTACLLAGTLAMGLALPSTAGAAPAAGKGCCCCASCDGCTTCTNCPSCCSCKCK